MNIWICRISKIIIALCVPIVMLLLAVQISAFDSDYYQAQYKKNSTAATMNITQQELDAITKQVFLYLSGDRQNLDITVQINGTPQQMFNQKEKDHMVDVQKLFLSGFLLRNILLALIAACTFLVFLREKKPLRSIFSYVLVGIFAFTLLCVLLAVIISSDFEKYFVIFHKIFFTNDLWQLDPATDRLIQLVPLDFFVGIASNIAILTAKIIVVTCAVAGVGVQSTKCNVYRNG